MTKLTLLGFIDTYSTLVTLITALRNTDHDSISFGGNFYDEIKIEIDSIYNNLIEMELVVSAKSAQRLKEIISRDNFVSEQHLTELHSRIKDELGTKVVLILRNNKMDFFEQKSPIFGEEILNKLPRINEDSAEAGYCFALDRYTACVFHLMRVIEISVQELGRKLGVSLVDYKMWQRILNEVNMQIEALPSTDNNKLVYASLSAHLYNVKVAWRNEVMHPKATYTEEEARELINSVKTFLNDLVKIL